MKIDFEKMKNKLGNIAKYCVKFVLYGAVWFLPLMYLIWCPLKNGTKFEYFTFAAFVLLGLCVSIFVWNYARRDKDEIDMESKNFDNEDSLWDTIKFWGKNKSGKKVPWWQRLCDFAIIGYLVLTGIIMGKGLLSLFVDDNPWTIAFVVAFSLVVTFTLWWLVKMIARRGKQWYMFIVFYFLFDILSAFTFNYFHFYDNVSKTQRMENAIKYSQKLVEMVGTPISEEISRLDSIGNSEQVQTLQKNKQRIEDELNNISKERQNPTTKSQTYTWTDDNGNPRSNTKEVRVKTDQQLNEEETDATEKLKKTDEELNGFYQGTSGNSMSILLNKEDALCKSIQSKIREFHKVPKSDKPHLRDNIVNEINTLGGMLRKTPLANISQDSISNMVEIIKLPEVTRLESIESLFNAINFSSNKTDIQKTDIQKSENRLVYMSVTLSILIDLLPMLLALFVAISVGKDNDNTMRVFLRDKTEDKEE